MATPVLELEGTWEELAAHAPEFVGRRLRLLVYPPMEEQKPVTEPASRRHTARELLKLPMKERNRILEEQAAKAEPFYRNDPELTAFEALGEEDFFDETP